MFGKIFKKKDISDLSSSDSGPQAQKFGTFLGVYIPSILTILGVIMYLRMGWVVGTIGLAGTILIVILSSIVTFLTSLSISATATNMTVRTGGAYFMISRSFGVESGAAIGLPLFFAQALGISFYVAGFAESIVSLYPFVPVHVVGMVALICLSLLAFFSPGFALKTQLFIFVVIVASIISFLFGGPKAMTPPEAIASAEKFSFWAVFAIFFPAVTGILSGVSMSGDLKDPGKSIPIGTIAAVLSGLLVYLLIPIFLWKYATREQLLHDNMIMAKLALFAPLLFAGLWGATLSSALGSLLAAPRTLQALATDRIVPGVLGTGHGASREPRIATALTFVIAAVGICFGSLDIIAPLLTMFFLTSYGILNFIAGFETLVGNPSWRPRFKVHWLLSFAGGICCFAIMMLIDAASAYVAFFACGMIYILMKRRNVNANWSDARRGVLIHLVRLCIYKLSEYVETGKTWRPNLFVISGAPTSHWYLIEFADALSHGKGFLTVCSILKGTNFTREKVKGIENSMRSFLERKKIPALTKVKLSDDFVDSISGLVSDYGIGNIVPNTVVFGEPGDEENFSDFCSQVKTIYELEKNILIIRNPNKSSDDSQAKKRRPGSERTIDIWWGNNSRNSHLMLALSYMLQTSPEWMGSRLRVRSLVKDEDERQGILDNLKFLASTSRINAAIEVFVRVEGEDSLKQIRKYSKDSSLVFIGMLPPKKEESGEDYSLYYDALVERTKDFPMTIVTLAGENVRFQEIFT